MMTKCTIMSPLNLFDFSTSFCPLPNEIYMLFAGWEVCIVKNCDRGLENAKPANNLFFSSLSQIN